MSLERVIKDEALRFLPTAKDCRKRFMVSDGELFQLYKEIILIRKKEDREHLKEGFKKLLADAQLLKMIVQPKNETI